MTNNRTQLLTALKNLEDAFIQLTVVWSLEDNIEAMATAQNEVVKYPFSKSFDELTNEVSEWTYWLRKELGEQIN